MFAGFGLRGELQLSLVTHHPPHSLLRWCSSLPRCILTLGFGAVRSVAHLSCVLCRLFLFFCCCPFPLALCRRVAFFLLCCGDAHSCWAFSLVLWNLAPNHDGHEHQGWNLCDSRLLLPSLLRTSRTMYIHENPAPRAPNTKNTTEALATAMSSLAQKSIVRRAGSVHVLRVPVSLELWSRWRSSLRTRFWAYSFRCVGGHPFQRGQAACRRIAQPLCLEKS